MKTLTPRQFEVYDFICRRIIETHRSPTYTEIGEHFGFSEKAAYDHVIAMDKKGYLKVIPGTSGTTTIQKNVTIYEGTIGPDNLPIQIVPKNTEHSAQFEDIPS